MRVRVRLKSVDEKINTCEYPYINLGEYLAEIIFMNISTTRPLLLSDAGRPDGLTGSVVSHISIAPGFKP